MNSIILLIVVTSYLAILKYIFVLQDKNTRLSCDLTDAHVIYLKNQYLHQRVNNLSAILNDKRIEVLRLKTNRNYVFMNPKNGDIIATDDLEFIGEL
jgi:hypothetical protein